MLIKSIFWLLQVFLLSQIRISLSLSLKNADSLNHKTYQITEKMKLSIPRKQWQNDASNHISKLYSLLYPPGETDKSRMHSVYKHPVYNFLHTYYRYSIEELKNYSPGMSVYLEDVAENDLFSKKNMKNSFRLHDRMVKLSVDGCYWDVQKDLMFDKPNSRYGWINLTRTRDILQSTTTKTAFLGCFGLHEWAMLYSGKNKNYINQQKEENTSDSDRANTRERHQKFLPLRVNQKEIDFIVESGGLKCTHYDAWRFFHPDSQSWNIINPLNRGNQIKHEQPGCVHTNMDLFKYAFNLYPLISSDLLLESIDVAVTARKIDMRASPYDVSQFNIGNPLCVETKQGREEYVIEQEKLSIMAAPVREKLLKSYNEVLLKCQEIS